MKQWPEIHDIITSNRFSEFRDIVECNPKIAVRNEYEGETLLHTAAEWNRSNFIELLLDKGADVNKKAWGDWAGETILHIAARRGRKKLVELLLERGADINVRDDLNYSAAYYAATCGPKSLVNFLVKSGAVYDLNVAVCMGDLKRVKEIYKLSDDPVSEAPVPGNLVLDAIRWIRVVPCAKLNSAWSTPGEYYQAMKKSDSILRLLLEKGAARLDPRRESSPLFKTVQYPTTYITELLLQYGADPNCKSLSLGDDLSSCLAGSMCKENMYEVLKRYGYKGGRAQERKWPYGRKVIK